MKVAIIPARGGSKRIPYKNIKHFADRPVISYAIDAAKKTQLFDRIIVSTDDEKIAKIAQQYGAEIPFIRSKDLSDDLTHIGPVVRHCAHWLADAGQTPEFICTIFATAPLIDYQDISAAYNIIASNKNAGNISTVSRFPSPVQRALRITKSGQLEMIQPDNFLKRSQDLEETYFDVGQFFWTRYEAMLNKDCDTQYENLPYVISRSRAQDIDTIEDWIFAEILYNVLQFEV